MCEGCNIWSLSDNTHVNTIKCQHKVKSITIPIIKGWTITLVYTIIVIGRVYSWMMYVHFNSSFYRIFHDTCIPVEKWYKTKMGSTVHWQYLQVQIFYLQIDIHMYTDQYCVVVSHSSMYYHFPQNNVHFLQYMTEQSRTNFYTFPIAKPMIQ